MSQESKHFTIGKSRKMKIASSTKRYYKRFVAHHAKHRISESLMRQKTLPEKRMILRFYCIKCVTGNGITF